MTHHSSPLFPAAPSSLVQRPSLSQLSTTPISLTTKESSSHVALLLKLVDSIYSETREALDAMDTIAGGLDQVRPRKRRKYNHHHHERSSSADGHSHNESTNPRASPEPTVDAPTHNAIFSTLRDCLSTCDKLSMWTSDFDAIQHTENPVTQADHLWMSVAAYNGFANHELRQLMDEEESRHSHTPLYSDRQLIRMNHYAHPTSKLNLQKHMRPVDSLMLMSTSFRKNLDSDHEELSLLRTTPKHIMEESTKYSNLELHTIHVRGRSSAWHDMKKSLDNTLPLFTDTEKFIMGTTIRTSHSVASGLDVLRDVDERENEQPDTKEKKEKNLLEKTSSNT